MSCVHEVSQMDAEGRLGRENKVGPLMPLRASVDAQDWGAKQCRAGEWI
jgi:hypothetical protein